MTDKTTIGITPAHAKQLDRLAWEMGHRRGRAGNVSDMLRHLADLVKDFGPRVVAASLAPERLAEVAGTLGQEGDDD